MAACDLIAALPNMDNCIFTQYVRRRWFTSAGFQTMLGMMMALSMPTFLETTLVIGPAGLPPEEKVLDILQDGCVEGALLSTDCIKKVWSKPLKDLKLPRLKVVQYYDDSLTEELRRNLDPIHVVPCISDKATGILLTNVKKELITCGYVAFEKHAGVEFHEYSSNLHEFSIVRQPDYEVEPAFWISVMDSYWPKELWVQHPISENYWRRFAKCRDMPQMRNSALMTIIEAHMKVRSAIVFRCANSILLVELFPEALEKGRHEKFVESLQPYIEKFNSYRPPMGLLSTDRLIIARKRHFARIADGSVDVMETYARFNDEIKAILHQQIKGVTVDPMLVVV
ncbi:hypothetical protein EYZ11_008754 [Aspergillus tanneri]|uniref:Uncharacterized protein n=1 Tax=Aspergillus tanneri TaxID=1220188 RepID=A0A4S3J9P7_9EURO|nr:hypothetical protein EYZ11_008754 [Aspergillus tanneri]